MSIYDVVYYIPEEMSMSMANDPLVKGLDNEDRKVRFSALWGLAEIGGTDIIDLLLPILQDNETEIELRKSVARVLGYFNNPRAIEGLVIVLTDSDLEMRREAASCLRDLQIDKYKDVLVTALDDKDSLVRRYTADALGESADEVLLEKLGNMVLLEEATVAKGAARGLAFASNEMALHLLRQAVNKRPEMAYLHSCLGVLLRHLGRSEEGLEAHNEAIRLNNSSALFYSYRATAYLDMEKYELAASDFKRAVALDPEWAGPWEGLACSLIEMDLTDQAISAWWRAKSVANGDPIILASFGVGLWITDERENALRLWQRAVAREPRFVEDWKWVKREQAWGPKMMKVAQEIVATIEMTRNGKPN